MPRVGEIDIEKVIDYIRKNPDDKWFLRPMVGKTPDPEEMEQLVKAGAPLAIHGFTKALQQAVKDDPRYELIERMCDVLMFFYEKDGVGAYWVIDDTLHNTNVADPKEYAKAINTVRQQQWLVHKFLPIIFLDLKSTASGYLCKRIKSISSDLGTFRIYGV